MPPVDGYNLLKHEHKEKCTTGTENGTVESEEESREFSWLTCLHYLANTKGSSEMADKDTYHDWVGRERSSATDIMCEVVRKLREGNVREDQVGDGHSGTDGVTT